MQASRRFTGCIEAGNSGPSVRIDLDAAHRAVCRGTHVRSILQKLDLEESPEHHRRVLAVLTLLGER